MANKEKYTQLIKEIQYLVGENKENVPISKAGGLARKVSDVRKDFLLNFDTFSEIEKQELNIFYSQLNDYINDLMRLSII